MYQQITIKTLHNQGERQTDIARQMNCHRNTVRNVLKRDDVRERQTRQKSSVRTPYHDQIKTWREKDISRRRIAEMLSLDYGLSHSYDGLCKYIQGHFPAARAEAFGVQIHEPGETAEIDFGYLGLLPGPTGHNQKTYGLAVTLPFSRLGFWTITYDQKMASLCQGLRDAFLYFSGTPKRLKVDNMKAAVLVNQHYDLTLNPDFLEFTAHFNCVIVPCTPYSPQQKGTVESAVKYLQGNFLAGRTFTSQADLQSQLVNWRDNYANQRVHGTTGKIPREEFVRAEREYLLPLPSATFTFFNSGERLVSANCHIHLENNYYSVPFDLVGKTVTVRYTDRTVRVLYHGEQVALHPRYFEAGRYVTVREHLPPDKVYSQSEYQKRAEAKMVEMGPFAHKYFSQLLLTKDSYWFRSVRILLGLAQNYGNAAVDLSLKRALAFETTNLTIIKNILEKKLYLEGGEPTDVVWQATDNSRDLSYYER